MNIHVRWGLWMCLTLFFSLVVGVGCGTPTPGKKPKPPKTIKSMPDYAARYVSGTHHLVRASMALRGTRPSTQELKSVADSPKALEGLIDKYLKSPLFGRRMRAIHASWFLINVSPDYYPAAFPVLSSTPGVTPHQLNRDVIEAAPRLVEHIILADKPYTDIVKAPYTLANEVVSKVWGITRLDSKAGWQKAKYKDKRPMSGVLSDGFMFTRHASTSANRNRGRAQQMARIFLCVDYTNRVVDLKGSLDLSDELKVRHAVRQNKACNSCHQTLDPLASFFASHYPLRLPDTEVAYPLRQYAPEFKDFFRTAKPAYFGKSGDTIADLGRFIAEDPRFLSCMTQRFYSEMMDLKMKDVPRQRVEHFAKIFKKSKFSVKELLKAIVLSDDFRALQAKKEATKEAQRVVGFRRAKPDQLDALFYELTGFRWQTDIQYGSIGRVNLTTDSFFGYSVLGGASDGYDVWWPMLTVNPTTILLVRGLAARAAPHVVAHDFSKPSAQRKLLKHVDKTTVDEATIRKQLVALHLRLYGDIVKSNSPEVTRGWALFSGVLAASKDTSRAWTLTLYALLQDIRMLYY